MTIGAKVTEKNVKLSLGVTVRDARINTSYVLPAAAINYILLKTHAELDTLNKNPFFPDSIVSVDSSYIGFNKNLADFLDTSGDSISLGVTKPFTDSFSVSDLPTLSVGYVRNFDEVIASSDSSFNPLNKYINDSVSLTDTLRFDTGIKKADSSTMVDVADITNGPDWVFGKSTQDVLTATESIKNGVGKAFSDTISSTDAGLLFMTDYADITYFAADYVGTSITF